MAPAPDPTLFWHRRDLRTVDNRGLLQAADGANVLPVYVLDPTLITIAGPRRRDFFRRALEAVQDTYRQEESDLIVRNGDPEVEIPELVAEYGAESVVWNQDHSQYAVDRDLSILQELEDHGVSVTEVPDMTLHEPGSIRTSAGDHYSVFSYYYKKWADRPVEDPVPGPAADRFAAVQGPPVSSVWDEAVETSRETNSRPGETTAPLDSGREAARGRLESFLDGPIYDYADNRDIPAAEATSRLSQDLKFGLLGPREVFVATRIAADRAPDEDARESVEAFQRQLAWRDFYVQVLAANPETVWENFAEFEQPIDWRDDPAGFDAWTQGETGFPIVDAGMRQLLETGFMHNRVRMLVASFLTKDLQIDWRAGYRWFRERLVDHETANDVGGWQWAASTGTDAQPYFRVFNPMTQGERYDPDAEYIRNYVPELTGVEPATIHRWPELESSSRRDLAPGYPAPIVDHAARRESAIEMFERARGGS